MPGFIGFIGENKLQFNKENRQHLLIESKSNNTYNIERRTINKFLNDKVFFDDQDFFILTEGVILNRLQLEIQYNTTNFKDCIVKMYRKKRESFFNDFRGSFSGIFCDKVEQKWIIYTNHIGDKQVFYNESNDGLLVGTEMHFMVETLKNNAIPISINKNGVYLLLTHSFLIEDHTLVKGIKKLTAGHYLRYDKNGLQEIEYHRFSNKPKQDMSVEEAINGIDFFFRSAVKLQFDKDTEYNFKHVTNLSGGLDSRMTVWVAHLLGYEDQLNLTFSQSNYLDFSIAQQIATDLHHDFLFKPLDHGDFILSMDDISKLTYGSTTIFGLAMSKSMTDLVNFEQYGINHTGMIGDSIIGTFFKKNEYNELYKIGMGAFSYQLIDRLSNYIFKYKYENEEIYCLYTRAFTGANQGNLIEQEYTECCSPFCDVDFLEFCYSIPLILRFNHKIYFDWILRKYPKAAEYVWEKKREKIHAIENKESKYMNLLGKKVPAINDAQFGDWLTSAVLRRLELRKKEVNSMSFKVVAKDHMNPVDYWYEENNKLKIFINAYWENNKYLIKDNVLFADMEFLFNQNPTFDKLLVLSVLSALKLIEK